MTTTIQTKSITRSITRKDYWAYDLALRAANLSECRYKIGSVIISASRVLSVGHNVLKSHTDHAAWPAYTVSIHAEHHAILKAQCGIEGSTIVVARSGGNGISKPCPKCYEYIKLAGIRDIVYSDGRELIKIRVI